MKSEMKRTWWNRFLVLCTLTGFGVAQPIYDLVGRTPEFLLVHDARPPDLVLLVVALSLGPPLLLSLVEQLFGLVGRSWQGLAHLVNAGLLAGAFFLLLSKRWLDSHAIAAVVVALVLATLLVIGYARSAIVGQLLRFLSPSILVFLILFLARAGIREMLWPPAVADVAVGEISGQIPVVFVVFDALPLVSLLDADGTVDAVRYPSFAALAATSTWFDNATTVGDGTLRALPPILSGMRSVEGAVPTRAAYPINLFTILGPSYEINAVESLTKLCPEELCASTENPTVERLSLLASDLKVVYLHLLGTEQMRARLPSIDTEWLEFRRKRKGRDRASRRTRLPLFNDWVAGIDSDPRRALFFIHSMVPHAPHQHLPSGRRYTRSHVEPSGESSPWDEWVDDEWAVLHSQQRHLLQVMLADNLLGGLLHRLHEQKLFDDAIVVVTSDHGASFRPGVPHRRLDDDNIADIAMVPLFIKRPGQREASVDSRPVETIDILPTVADLLGLDLRKNVDGHPLFDSAWPGRERKRIQSTKPVEVDSAGIDVRASLARKIDVFGTGETRGAFPRVEAYPELLGEEPGVVLEASTMYRVSIDGQRSLANVRPRRGFIPAQISGILQLSEPRELPICLAVAVNGPIEATTCVYRETQDRKVRKWSVLVPEAVLRRGPNLVSVFVIDASGEDLGLIPTELE